MKRLIIASLLTVAAIAPAAAKDSKCTTDTLVVVTNPAMHCSNCENRIKENIRFVKGTKRIEASAQTNQVTIIYDNRKASYNDYGAAFAKIGYSIETGKGHDDAAARQ